VFDEKTLMRHDMLDPIKHELAKREISWGRFAFLLRLSFPDKTKNQRLEIAEDYFDRGRLQELIDLINAEQK
jgi:hypothetical protein